MIGKLVGVVVILGVAAADAAASHPMVHGPAPRSIQACLPDPSFGAAARQNASTVNIAPWSVLGRPETGWAIYAPLTAHEIGTPCQAADSEGFAAALAAWQGEHGLPSNGIMDEATLRALDRAWQGRRPFVVVSAHGVCPAPPATLSSARVDEGYGGKQVQLRAGALGAYRRMVAAARADDPTLAADKRLLTIFSGYRDPVADAARCAKEQNCNAVVRATCSAHRTGLAMDLFLGAAPGFPPDSSADLNRLYQSRSNAYRWMVAHAGQFGFVNYPFEPWHWEWTGEPP